MGVRGTKPLRPSDVRSLHPEAGHGTQFASGMDLSPLEYAVAAKHRVLPVFSRNRPRPSPLEFALLSLLASVDSKWFTARLTRLESALTKNTFVPLRASRPHWQPRRSRNRGHGRRRLPHPSHCGTSPLVQQSPKVRDF